MLNWSRGESSEAPEVEQQIQMLRELEEEWGLKIPQDVHKEFSREDKELMNVLARIYKHSIGETRDIDMAEVIGKVLLQENLGEVVKAMFMGLAIRLSRLAIEEGRLPTDEELSRLVN